MATATDHALALDLYSNLYYNGAYYDTIELFYSRLHVKAEY